MRPRWKHRSRRSFKCILDSITNPAFKKEGSFPSLVHRKGCCDQHGVWWGDWWHQPGTFRLRELKVLCYYGASEEFDGIFVCFFKMTPFFLLCGWHLKNNLDIVVHVNTVYASGNEDESSFWSITLKASFYPNAEIAWSRLHFYLQLMFLVSLKSSAVRVTQTCLVPAARASTRARTRHALPHAPKSIVPRVNGSPESPGSLLIHLI